MNGPPVRDGGVVFSDGRVLAVGNASELRKTFADAVIHDAGNAVILPGLVNAHTHLELSALSPAEPPPRQFVDWIIQLMQNAGQTSPADAMRIGISQCLAAGVTTVGDITIQPGITRPVLAESPLRGISFGEVRAMAQRRGFLEPRLTAACEPIDSDRIAAGISPHAPYSIEANGYQRCLKVAGEKKLALTTHLAETAAEAEFLTNHIGPFKALWDHLNAWDEQVPRFTGGPIRFAQALGLLDYPTLLAHVNYCDDAELDLLAAGQAAVIYCPRTHAYFSHPPHRWRDMLKLGITVAVGTDSCASSPDLNLVDDLRLVHRLTPEVGADQIWELATINAARALGIPLAGSLAPGQYADAVVFPLTADGDPLLQILESQSAASQVWIAGSVIPFSANPLSRRMQASHLPQG